MTPAIASAVMPLMRGMDAETAHGIALRALSLGLAGQDRGADHPSLKTEVVGLRFRNPLGLAAGFDKDAEAVLPLLRLGQRRYVTDVLSGTVDGASVRIANHCFEDDSYDGKGRRTTTYTYHLVGLLEYPVAISPMRVVRRSGLGRMLKGADDATAGWGAMRVEDLENDLFRDRFSVRVADDADPVQVFAVFDPQVQEDLAEGRAIPAVDLVEAEGPWLMLASKGALDGDELDRVEVMIGSVRWAMATLGSHSPPSG